MACGVQTAFVFPPILSPSNLLSMHCPPNPPNASVNSASTALLLPVLFLQKRVQTLSRVARRRASDETELPIREVEQKIPVAPGDPFACGD
ncbi:hypothetical protein L209DRAFT_60326 [Thermothelomyces heterothallicus CBS 203.75]